MCGLPLPAQAARGEDREQEEEMRTKIIGEGWYKYEVPADFEPHPEWIEKIRAANRELDGVITKEIDKQIVHELHAMKAQSCRS